MKNQKAFTLVELMIVVCMLGIVSAIGFSVVLQWRQTAVVTVRGQEVFRGHAFCVKVASAGAATQVDIQPPCEFPGRHFTDKEITVTVN